MVFPLSYPLRELLLKSADGTLGNGQLHELHALCRHLAWLSVRKRVGAGRLNPALIGLSEQDIALDCIADLFATSPEGTLFEIAGYFEAEGIDVAHAPEDLLLAHLRRLVFSALNDSLFRIYSEIDPALSRIIRNLKLALRRSKRFSIRTVFDDVYLVPADSEVDHGKPDLGAAELQQAVEESLLHGDGIPSVLEHIGLCLQAQDAFRRRIPLIGLAHSIKAGYVKLGWMDRIETVQPADAMIEADVESIIADRCSSLSSAMYRRYVTTGKLDPGEFEGYWKAISEIIRRDYIGGCDGQKCYYEQLQSMIPGLTREEYAKRHRSYFEYMAITAKKAVRRELKEM